MPLPEKIQNAPEIQMGLELYFTAYLDLSTCRQITMGGPGPIPWDKIREYAHEYGFTRSQADRLESLCRLVDQAYLAWWESKHGGDKQKLRRVSEKNERRGGRFGH